MRRKSLWLAVAMLLLVGGGVLAALAALTQHEPAFYARCASPPGEQRRELSKDFSLRKFAAFTTSIYNGGNRQTGVWRGSFTEADLNSFFAEEFLSTGLADKLLPEGISDLRVCLEQDRMRLGFRYGSPPWSTVVSITFRVWLAKGESNVVVLELQSLHAGALPISAQSLLDQMSEVLRQHNIQMTWYRHNGHPTAAIKFQSDQPRPSAQLQQVELKPGMLVITGRSNDLLPTPPPPAAP